MDAIAKVGAEAGRSGFEALDLPVADVDQRSEGEGLEAEENTAASTFRQGLDSLDRGQETHIST
ncbi:hypothetical protein ACIQ7D_33100 [Streptomyces sp. NPDC096310]|uniref:hypothetical protein n=1 Tax=Streptomyces sp. NPDC096310 TaxID=3366082 RepID=UPI003828FFB5